MVKAAAGLPRIPKADLLFPHFVLQLALLCHFFLSPGSISNTLSLLGT